MMYTFFFICMLVGFGGLTVMSPQLDQQIIGGLLWVVNFILFRPWWR